MIRKCIVGVVLAGLAMQPMAAAESNLFSREIHPILTKKCFDCHGPSESGRRGGLRLDVADGEEGALTPRDGYQIIKPGAPEESLLWERITTTDADDIMPPADAHKDPITPKEREVIKAWIMEGATYQPFWSFIPPQRSTLDGIDAHVEAKLKQEGLQPHEEADKRTLIRRLTFELTGLPPTRAEIQAFLEDDGPDAYARLVERLIDEETYGEHMTRYWADLVRLGDTNGMHKDFFRDFSTYRDWIIRSFNENLPFDQFLKFQLAGDLFNDPTQDQLVASGFNRLHMIIDRGTALPEESLHKNVLDRVTAFGAVFMGMTVHCSQCHDHKSDPLTQKEFYELYAFFNNFAGEPETVREPPRGLQPPFINLTTPEQDAALASYREDKADLLAEITGVRREQQESGKWPEELKQVEVPWIWDAPALESTKVEFRTTLPLEAAPEKALVRFVGKSNAKVHLNGELIGRSFGLEQAIAAEVSGLLKAGENSIVAEGGGDAGFALILEYEAEGASSTFTTGTHWEAKGNKGNDWAAASEVSELKHEVAWTQKAVSTEIAELNRKVGRIEKKEQAFLKDAPAAMVMKEREPARETYVLVRGAYDAPGEVVERNTPAFLPPIKEKEGRYTRMDLAEWLLAPEHPLTARVAVNRIWQQFFGVGLVGTPDDFGAQGERPSHPDLLDDLTLDFVESGWDVKALVRQIVLSDTYKQKSDASPEAYRDDPDNRLLARGPRYRMDAEMLRDQILLVSGKLNRTMYGQSVKPPQPPGLWEMVSMAAPFTYVADTDDRIYRRSLYTYWRRGMPPPQMTIMNAPSREFCVARRERTNTPLQALLLMNEPEYLKLAQACAQETLAETGSLQEALEVTYEKITSHLPDAARLAAMESALENFKQIYGEDDDLTASLTAEIKEAKPEERVQLAAWTMLTHSLLNLEFAKVKR